MIWHKFIPQLPLSYTVKLFRMSEVYGFPQHPTFGNSKRCFCHNNLPLSVSLSFPVLLSIYTISLGRWFDISSARNIFTPVSATFTSPSFLNNSTNISSVFWIQFQCTVLFPFIHWNFKLYLLLTCSMLVILTMIL